MTREPKPSWWVGVPRGEEWARLLKAREPVLSQTKEGQRLGFNQSGNYWAPDPVSARAQGKK